MYANRMMTVRLADVVIQQPSCETKFYMTLGYILNSEKTIRHFRVFITDVMDNPAFVQPTCYTLPINMLLERDWETDLQVAVKERILKQPDFGICHTALRNFYMDLLNKNYTRLEAMQLIKFKHGFSDIYQTLFDEEVASRFLHANAKRIQRRWRAIVANPYHPIGKRRLVREFESLVRYPTMVV